MNMEEKKQNLIDYIHDFAFEFGKLWNTSLSHDEKIERIKEIISLPEEVVSNFINPIL